MESSGIRPGEVDIVNSYDGFSGFLYFFLEGYGFCGRGEAFEFIQDGRIRPRRIAPSEYERR